MEPERPVFRDFAGMLLNLPPDERLAVIRMWRDFLDELEKQAHAP